MTFLDKTEGIFERLMEFLKESLEEFLKELLKEFLKKSIEQIGKKPTTKVLGKCSGRTSRGSFENYRRNFKKKKKNSAEILFCKVFEMDLWRIYLRRKKS